MTSSSRRARQAGGRSSGRSSGRSTAGGQRRRHAAMTRVVAGGTRAGVTAGETRAGRTVGGMRAGGTRAGGTRGVAAAVTHARPTGGGVTTHAPPTGLTSPNPSRHTSPATGCNGTTTGRRWRGATRAPAQRARPGGRRGRLHRQCPPRSRQALRLRRWPRRRGMRGRPGGHSRSRKRRSGARRRVELPGPLSYRPWPFVVRCGATAPLGLNHPSLSLTLSPSPSPSPSLSLRLA